MPGHTGDSSSSHMDTDSSEKSQRSRSSSDMDIDGELGVYIQEDNRLARWRTYFDKLVEDTRQKTLSPAAGFAEQAEIDIETIATTLCASESAANPSLRRLEQRMFAATHTVYQLPFAVLIDFLDSVFGLDANNVAASNPRVDQRDVHMLHALEKSSPRLKDTIDVWAGSSYVVDAFDAFTRSFLNYDEAATAFRTIQKAYAASLDHLNLSWQLGVERGLRRGGNSLGYSCAMNCVHCLEFLVRHQFIKVEGYDGYGFSWLDGAIRTKNQEVFLYLLEQLSSRQFYNHTSVHHLIYKNITYDGKMAVFRFILREKWTWAVGHLLKKFIATNKQKKLTSHIDEPSQSRLLWFLTDDLAEGLRQGGYNVTDVSFPVPGEEQTIFHAAALHNTNGDSFMNWLYLNSKVEITAENYKGQDALQIAATGDNPANIQWLCRHLDPLKIWERPADGRHLANEYTGCALETAARNMTNISVFETMMNCIGHTAFLDFEVPLSIYKAISFGLHEFTTRGRPITQAATDQAYEIANAKSNILKARLVGTNWLHSNEMEQAMCEVWKYGFASLAASLSTFTNADTDRRLARGDM